MKKTTKKGQKDAHGSLPTRASHDSLADEARRWSSSPIDPGSWIETPEAAPGGTKPISMRLPVAMLEVLKGFANREGIGYQVLIKRWLDERIRKERDRLRALAQPERRAPPVVDLRDRADYAGSHYEWKATG